MYKIVSCDVLPQAIGHVLGKHQLDRLGCLVLGVECASPYIVSDVNINAVPIHLCSGEELHLLYSLMAFMQVC